jgi:hypothetical protein
MLLVNSSFVGGLGGARKAACLIQHLNQRAIKYRLVTDCHSLDKLRLVGLNPDVVFDVSSGMSSSQLYREVGQRLRRIEYDGMISFGWRTYVPLNAVERSKPAIIIDGGWPRTVEGMPSPFCKDVYQQLTAYCLTNFFFDVRLDSLLPLEHKIPFRWIAQPFDKEEVAWLKSLADRKSKKTRMHTGGSGSSTIFLDMNPEYVDPRQGTFTGGWLTPRQLDECRGFVSRLIVELDSAREPLVLVVHEKIARQLGPVVSKCVNLKIICHPSLPPAEHHQLRAGADLVILRAIRCVGATQAALSLVPALHAICPAAEEYMGEKYSCEIAEDLEIACSLDHEAASLRDGIMQHLYSQKSSDTATRAQQVALQSWKERGPDYILNLLGMRSLTVVQAANEVR